VTGLKASSLVKRAGLRSLGLRGGRLVDGIEHRREVLVHRGEPRSSVSQGGADLLDAHDVLDRS
jgi:hypothetical protein